MFSGSYSPQDVLFLLKPVHLDPTPIEQKEQLIQSGQRHYSEMIGPEQPPSPKYLALFHQALQENKTRLARDLCVLANLIAQNRPQEITLVSLARAGTPIGALLGRILRERHGRVTTHYSISIIRDRGLDTNALDHIVGVHSPQSIVFVDGWTGKGVMARELQAAITAFNDSRGLALDSGLYTVADLCGWAAVAASTEDYLIPSSILGATISGLVSRSILNSDLVSGRDFHACIHYKEFAAHDLSSWFLDVIHAEVKSLGTDLQKNAIDVESARQRSEQFLKKVSGQYGVYDLNHIKPGIGEATRVLLRRVPGCLLVRDPDQPEVAHLLLLARNKKVPVVVEPSLPYRAAALIRTRSAQGASEDRP